MLLSALISKYTVYVQATVATISFTFIYVSDVLTLAVFALCNRDTKSPKAVHCSAYTVYQDQFFSCNEFIYLVWSVPANASASVASSTNQLVVVVACKLAAALNSVIVVLFITPLAALSEIARLSALTGVVFAVAVLICFLI